VFTPAVTLWALLSQMLFTGEQRSCPERTKISGADLAALDPCRWAAELDPRDIKSARTLDVHRGESPDRVHQKLWDRLLA